jgi:hypothetical protein
MEVLAVIFFLGLGALVLYLAVGVVAFAVAIIWWCWPMIVGALVAAWLWASGHDNLAVLAALGFAGVQWWLAERSPPVGSGGNDNRTTADYIKEIAENLRK